VQVHSQFESDFAERMFVYLYRRIYDRYKRRVASIALLGDERSSWRPNQFGYELWGSEVLFKFPVVKLLDYTQLSALRRVLKEARRLKLMDYEEVR
jgi:hypothetical protein